MLATQTLEANQRQDETTNTPKNEPDSDSTCLKHQSPNTAQIDDNEEILWIETYDKVLNDFNNKKTANQVKSQQKQQKLLNENTNGPNSVNPLLDQKAINGRGITNLTFSPKQNNEELEMTIPPPTSSSNKLNLIDFDVESLNNGGGGGNLGQKKSCILSDEAENGNYIGGSGGCGEQQPLIIMQQQQEQQQEPADILKLIQMEDTLSHMSQRSVMETRKKVGEYLFYERDAVYKGPVTKLYIATNKNREFVMVKAFEKAKIGSSIAKKFVSEHKHLLKMTATNRELLVQLLDFFQTGSNYYLVYEFINGGSLKSYCKEKFTAFHPATSQFNNNTLTMTLMMDQQSISQINKSPNNNINASLFSLANNNGVGVSTGPGVSQGPSISKEDKIMELLEKIVNAVDEFLRLTKYPMHGNLKLENLFVVQGNLDQLKLMDYSATYRGIKEELAPQKTIEPNSIIKTSSLTSTDRSSDVRQLAVMAFQMMYGDSSAIFTKYEASFSRFVEKQSKRFSVETETILKSCLFQQATAQSQNLNESQNQQGKQIVSWQRISAYIREYNALKQKMALELLMEMQKQQNSNLELEKRKQQEQMQKEQDQLALQQYQQMQQNAMTDILNKIDDNEDSENDRTKANSATTVTGNGEQRVATHKPNMQSQCIQTSDENFIFDMPNTPMAANIFQNGGAGFANGNVGDFSLGFNRAIGTTPELVYDNGHHYLGEDQEQTELYKKLQSQREIARTIFKKRQTYISQIQQQGGVGGGNGPQTAILTQQNRYVIDSQQDMSAPRQTTNNMKQFNFQQQENISPLTNRPLYPFQQQSIDEINSPMLATNVEPNGPSKTTVRMKRKCFLKNFSFKYSNDRIDLKIVNEFVEKIYCLQQQEQPGQQLQQSQQPLTNGQGGVMSLGKRGSKILNTLLLQQAVVQTLGQITTEQTADQMLTPPLQALANPELGALQTGDIQNEPQQPLISKRLVETVFPLPLLDSVNKSKYDFQIINEIDDLPFFDIVETRNSDKAEDKFFIDLYERLVKQRNLVCRVQDLRTSQKYMASVYTVSEDIEFYSVLREIAIAKHIELNTKPSLALSNVFPKSNNNNGTGKSDQIEQSSQTFFPNAQSDENPTEEQKGQEFRFCESVYTGNAANNTQNNVQSKPMHVNYLDKLYEKAEQHIQEQQKQNFRLQQLKDVLIFKRPSNIFTFILLYDDVDYTMKDFIIRNKNKQQTEPEDCLFIANALTSMLATLRSVGIAHNNISPENLRIQIQRTNGQNFQLQQQQSFNPQKKQQNNNNNNARAFMVEKKPTLNEADEQNGSIQGKLLLLGSYQNAIIRTADQKFGNMLLEFQKNSPNMKYKGPEISAIMNISSEQSETIQCNPVDSDLYSIGTLLAEIRSKQIMNVRNTTAIIDKLNLQEKANELVLLLMNQNPQHRIKLKKAVHFCQEAYKHQTSIDSVPSQARNRRLCPYNELPADEIGELEGDLAHLLFYKGFRRMGIIDKGSQHLVSLKKKYISSNQNKRMFADQHKIEVQILREIASLHRELNEFDLSRKYFQEAMSALSKYDSDNHLDMAGLMQGLGEIQADDPEKNSGCANQLKHALAILRREMGTGDPKTVRLMLTLGDIYLSKDEAKSALQMYQECTIILKNSRVGFQGPQGIQLLEKVGGCYYRISEYENALLFFKKSLMEKENVFNAQKSVTIAETLNNIGECHRVLSRLPEAIEAYQRSLKIMWPMRQQPSVAKFIALLYNNMGICYKQNGLRRQALNYYEESHKLKVRIFGQESDVAMETLLNIAVLHDELGYHTKAVAFYEEIIAEFKQQKRTQADNPLYSECLQNHGVALYNMGYYQKALNILNDALELKKQYFGNIHVSVAHTYQNVAIVYHRLGKYSKALQHYDDALKILQKKLGPEHPSVKTVQENISLTSKFNKN